VLSIEYLFLLLLFVEKLPKESQYLYMKFVHAKTKVKNTTYRRIVLLLGAGGRMGPVTIVKQRAEKADGMSTL
jgi:hypothetical protein